MATIIGPLIGWQNRSQKRQVRAELLAGLPRAKSALFMPAAQCLCIEQAFTHGVISRQTHILAVEKDEIIFRKMNRTLRQLNLQAKPLNTALHRVPISRPLDLVFIDLNGCLTQEIADWMATTLAAGLLPQANVLICFAESSRNNRFIADCLDSLHDHAPDLLRTIAHDLNTTDYGVVQDICLFRILLRDWTFKVEFMLRYSDTIPMCAYRLYAFVRASQPLDCWFEGGRIMSDRSEAARRAWQTRRAANSNRRPNEKDWPPISFADIPAREQLAEITIKLLSKGVSNSDHMREVIRRRCKVKLDEFPTVNWNDTPTGKFINEHAHVLRDLVVREVIAPIARKEYRLRQQIAA